MKKLKLMVPALAVAACLAGGMMFGCSSENQSSEQAQPQTEYQKIINANTVQNLAGNDGTLGCTVEIYGEDSTLEDTTAIEWTMSNGTPSIKWKDVMDDETQLAISNPSNDNCGAVYTLDEGDESVFLYAQNNFTDSIFDEWNTLIDYAGTESEVVTNESSATLEVTQELVGGEDSYYKAIYTFDPTTYALSSVEITDYATEGDTVLERMVVKDISTDANLALEQNPYEVITGGTENESCNLTVVVNDLNGEKYTSTYKVSRESDVELMIAEDFDIYSDEAMTALVEEINVDQAAATVYVQVKETSDTEDGEDFDSLSIDSDEAGTEYVSEDGAVLKLGEDGNLYDEAGNMVSLDDIEGEDAGDETGEDSE